jgi:LSD1 subclass zinc finger protein
MALVFCQSCARNSSQLLCRGCREMVHLPWGATRDDDAICTRGWIEQQVSQKKLLGAWTSGKTRCAQVWLWEGTVNYTYATLRNDSLSLTVRAFSGFQFIEL